MACCGCWTKVPLDARGALRAAVSVAELRAEVREVEESEPRGWGVSWSISGWPVS